MESNKGKDLAAHLIDSLLEEHPTESKSSEPTKSEVQATIARYLVYPEDLKNKEKEVDEKPYAVGEFSVVIPESSSIRQEVLQSEDSDKEPENKVEVEPQLIDKDSVVIDDEPVVDEPVLLQEEKQMFSSVKKNEVYDDRTQEVRNSPSTNVLESIDEKTQAALGAVQRQKIQTQVGIGYVPGGSSAESGNKWTSHESALVQSENLRIAQKRILELEVEIERLREENESLTSAGETLKRRTEEMQGRIEALQNQYSDAKEIHEGESQILKESLAYRDKENSELKLKIDELETRLAGDLKKIRIRERELENRLELVRMESSTLIRSKDENILELKRQIDQLTTETENYRQKCQELYKQMEMNQDRFRRTVKALRLALSNLETSEGGVIPFKKAE